MTQDGHEIVQSFEGKALKKRPIAIRIADYLTTSFGTISFFLLNAIVFALWIAINYGYWPIIPVFDPEPFNLLTMVVSLEAIFLSIIVLMSQNRQSYISTLREELDMQVNLIAEREITKILKLLRIIINHHGIILKDKELEEMIKEIDTSYIERALEAQLNDKPKSFLQKVARPFVKEVEKVEKTILPEK